MKKSEKTISFIAKFTDEIIDCISIEPGYYRCTNDQRYEVLGRVKAWIDSEMMRETEYFDEEPQSDLFSKPDDLPFKMIV